jgi:hypothetical protein
MHLNKTFRRFLILAKNDCWLRHACLSVCLSVCLSAWNNSAPTDRLFPKFGTLTILGKSVEQIQFGLQSAYDISTLLVNPRIFMMTISR